jgi:hypothetical protein
MNWDIFLEPFKELATTVAVYLPRIVAVLVLLLIAWILAKVLRSAVRKALRASKVDERLGKGGDVKDEKQFPVAQGAGTVVYWLVWLFFGLAILQSLGVEGILDSVVILFEKIFSAVPNIIGAVIVLVIFYFLGRLLARWITKFLTSIRFNEVPVKLGLAKQPIEGQWSPASIVGYIGLALIMLFAVIMAAELLEFTIVSELVSQLTEFLGLVILAVIILGIGIFLANLAANMLRPRSQTLASAARILIMVLVIAMALRTMGFANEIIILGFSLMLGAIALAVAIAFGLGGREPARNLLDRWTKSIKSEKTDKSND